MELLGKIGWETGVDPSGTEAGLARLEAEIRAVMADIEKMDATVDIKADISEVEKRTLQAERELTDFTRKYEDLARRQKEAAAAKNKALAKQLGQEKKDLAEVIRRHKEYLQDLRNERKEIASNEREYKRLNTQLTEKAKLADRLRTAGKRTERQLQDEAVKVEKLRSTYQKLILQRRALTTGTFKKFGMFRSDTEVQQIRTIHAQMEQLGNQIRTLGSDTRDLDDDTDNSSNSFSKMATALADTRVHLGFLSLSLKGLAIGLATVGPMLLDVVGALGALVGVTAGGLIGALGLAATGFTAVGLGAFGIIQAIQPLTADIGLATGAFEDLAAAEAEFGKNSKEAKEAQKALDGILKQIGPRAAEVAKLLHELGRGFEAKTGATRRSMADLMVTGLQRASALMPAFADQTNRMAAGMAEAGENFMAAFSAPEMERTMNAIMGNFSDILPRLGTGLGNTFEGLANIMTEFSTHFDSMADGFVAWSEGFVTATQDGERLTGTVDRLMQSAGQLVDFLGSAGGLLRAFFGIGQEAGGNLMDDMTAQMDEWTNSMNEDPSGVNDFFERSAEGAKDLYNVLAPLGSTFLNVAEAMQPVTEGLLAILEGFADILSFLSGNSLGQALMTAFGAFTGVKMLTGLLSKLPLIGGLFGKLGTSAGGAAGKVGMLGRGLALVGGPLGALAIGAVFIADQMGFFSDETAAAHEELVSAQEGLSGYTESLRTAGESINATKSLQIDLADALAKGGAKGKQAALQIRSSFAGLKTAIENSRSALTESRTKAEQEIIDPELFDDVQTGFKVAAMYGEEFYDSALKNGKVTQSWQEKLRAVGATSADIDRLNDSLSPTHDLIRQIEHQTKAVNFQMANLKRARSGFDALGASARSAMGGLSKTFASSRVLKWSVQIDDRQAQTKMLELLNKVRQLGGRQAIIRIMASDKGAAEKMRALEQLKQKLANPVQFAIKAASKPVESSIDSILKGAKEIEKTRTMPIREKGGQEVEAQLDFINAFDIAPKTAVIRGDDSHVRSVLASLPKTINITANIVGGTASAIVRGARAAGGPLVPEYATGGGFITKPTFLTGEEAPRHPEFVIATNPAYRQDNVKYLMQAASMLGVEGFARGGPTAGNRFQIGAIPQEKAQSAYDRADAAYDNYKDKPAKNRSPNELERLYKRRAQALSNLRAVKQVNKKIRHEEAEISRDTSLMDQYAAQGDTEGFNEARTDRLGNIDDLLRVLTRAEGKASGTFQIELQDRIAQLRSEKEEVERALPGGGATLTGAEARRLAEISREQAEAALTPGLMDDIEGNRALVSFWESVLGRLRSDPNSSDESITEAAQALLAAREGQLNIGGGGIESQGGAFASERLDLYRSFGSNTAWQGGEVTSQPPASGPTINNNFAAPPPDPHTWSTQQAFELATMG